MVTLPSGGILNGFDFPQIPRFNIEVPDLPSIPEEVCYRFHWEPEDPETRGIYLAGSDAPEVTGDPSILIDILSCVAPLELDASQTIEVDFKNFGVAVPPAPFIRAIELGFHRVAYCKQPGQEATTDIDFAGLRFVGALGFLDPVREFFEDLSDNFSVVADPSGVFAEAKIPIPPVELGVLALRNLEAIVGVDVSFDGSPVVMNASLGRQVDPFEVRVLAAGGIGWFELDASTENGVERLSAGFAVTYTTGIDIIVASASITGSIGGGIEVLNGEVTVLIFISIEGVASALGLSVGFSTELELYYNSATEVLRGIARVTVGFYSKIVNLEKTFEIEQEIVLGDGNPPAGQQVSLAAKARATAVPVSLALSDTKVLPVAQAAANPGSGFSDQYTSTTWAEYAGGFA